MHIRRNNLVFMVLEGGLETGNSHKMMGDILSYILDLTDNYSLYPHLAQPEPLCLYLMHMLRWSDREKISGVEAKKKTADLEGKSVPGISGFTSGD